MSDHTNPLDAPWETVDLVLIYQDGRQTKQRDVRLVRAEVEATERETAEVNARERYSDDREALDEALEHIEQWQLTPDEFQNRVMSNVENMVVAPLRVRSEAVNSFRILPPWAVQEVRIVVNAQQESPLFLPAN